MTARIIIGDARVALRNEPDCSVQACITSPPYFGLRDYGVSDQIGLELTPDAYVAELVSVFREVWRVLRADGTLWLILGDSYSSTSTRTMGSKCALGGGLSNQAAALNRPDKSKLPGLKIKDLIGIPWMVAFALRADGWYLRQDIIWHKPNPMPESMNDRCTKAHEYLFLLSKSPSYYFDASAIAEDSIYAPANTTEIERTRGYYGGKWAEPSGGKRNDGAFKAIREKRNKRSVWTIPPASFRQAHFATFPEKLVEPCILAGAPIGALICDPFAGAGTTAVVAESLGRNSLSIEINPEYAAIADNRIRASLGRVEGGPLKQAATTPLLQMLDLPA